MEKEGTEIVGRKELRLEEIFSDRRTQTKYAVEKWS
jgi:hypothetical protein